MGTPKASKKYSTTLMERGSFWFYGIGMIFYYMIVGSYMNTFLLLQGIDLAKIAVILLVVKIWDAVNDPLFAYIFDRIKFKKEKCLPWLRIAAILMPLASIGFFNMPSGMGETGKLKNLGKANCLIPPILKESASGGLISTVDDYMKFQEALCRENVLLHKRTTDLMRIDQVICRNIPGYGYSANGMGYGLGVRTVTDRAANGGPTGFGPYGWGGAAGTYGSIDPENEITIFYAQHVFGTEDGRTHARVRNLVYSGL